MTSLFPIGGRLYRASLAAGLMLCLGLAPAGAGVLLDVGGANQAVTIEPGEAAAASFTLGQSVTGLTLDAPVLCLGCSGGVWLQANTIGSGSSYADAVGAIALSDATPKPFFNIAALDPGTYFLIVSVDSGSPTAAIWSGSTTSALVLTGSGASLGPDFFATSIQPFVPFSEFQVSEGSKLNFSLNGQLASTAVPEPQSWLLMIVGLGIAGAAYRRSERRRSEIVHAN